MLLNWNKTLFQAVRLRQAYFLSLNLSDSSRAAIMGSHVTGCEKLRKLRVCYGGLVICLDSKCRGTSGWGFSSPPSVMATHQSAYVCKPITQWLASDTYFPVSEWSLKMNSMPHQACEGERERVQPGPGMRQMIWWDGKHCKGGEVKQKECTSAVKTITLWFF